MKQKTIPYYLKTLFFIIAVTSSIVSVEQFVFQQKKLCANSKSCISDLKERIENNVIGVFQGKKVYPPKITIASDNKQKHVLGENVSPEDKHIYVDLSKQILYAFEGKSKIFQTFVSTGRWNKTPVGNFHVWTKIRATRMTGGEGADYYDLPNVPWVMYFYNDFGLHGAYWHDNFGHTMSHGCVNLRQIDAEHLYNWADGPTADHKGTAVSICNSFAEPDNCIQKDPIQL